MKVTVFKHLISKYNINFYVFISLFLLLLCFDLEVFIHTLKTVYDHISKQLWAPEKYSAARRVTH